MNIAQRLQGVTRLFLDTAPIIYFVEENERYLPLVESVFDLIDQGALVAVTSPITLAECLVIPYRDDRPDLQQAFSDLITNGANTLFTSLDDSIAKLAAELRAKHNLSLTDAFQIATAISSGCDAFLTNDAGLKRINQIPVIVLDDIQPESPEDKPSPASAGPSE